MPVETCEGHLPSRLYTVAKTQGTLTDRLEQSQRDELGWLHRVFANAPVFMVVVSAPDCKIELTNRAFDDLCAGRTMVGLSVAEALPETAVQDFAGILRLVCETGSARGAANVTFIAGPDTGNAQSARQVDFICRPVRGDDGKMDGILCVGHDLSGQHHDQAEAERAKDRFLRASRINAMGTMAMTVAHELNQPLTAAANYLCAAQRLVAKPDRDPGPVLKRAEVELLRAGEVIRRVRAMMDSGHARRTAVSIQHVYDRAVMRLRACDGDTDAGGIDRDDLALELGRNRSG